MKKFIKHFILFVSPIVILAYFIDVFISNNLRKSNKFAEGEYTTWNAIFDKKINSDVVIYGSSRAWVHFDPTIMTKKLNLSAYNLGIDGHNFWLQYLRHKVLLKHNKKPKIIILSVDLFSLQKRKDLYNYEQFFPYMLWNEEIALATHAYEGFGFFDYKVPLVRYYGQYQAIENAIRYSSGHLSNPICRVRGYEGQELTWNDNLDKAKAKVKKYKAVLDSSTIELFEQFLNECKRDNIKLVFVYAPEYIEGQSFVENRGEVIKMFSDFSKRYEILFYDYSKDSISFQKKCFYNSLHLNKIGSELFTSKFIDTLMNSKILISN